VTPVTFAPGSSVLSPAMEEHLTRVADVLRRAPFVNLALRPVSSAGDADALRAGALGARLREIQKARGLPDAAAALAAYYREQFPGPPPAGPPPTPDEQMARLREREPPPTAELGDLERRRLEATRERLVATEGIPAERLGAEERSPGSAGPPPGAAEEGRVDLDVVPGG
jgi:hypothetical protein